MSQEDFRIRYFLDLRIIVKGIAKLLSQKFDERNKILNTLTKLFSRKVFLKAV